MSISMSYLILDLVVLALLLVCVLRGWHTGLILTVCGLLASLIAFAGAAFLSNQLAQPMSTLLQPGIQAGLEAAIRQSLPSASTSSAAVDTQQLPLRTILNALEDSALYSSLAESFQDAVEKGTDQVLDSAVRSLSEFAARELSRVLVFLVAFVLISVGWLLISHGLDLVSKLPGLNQLNRGLGAGVGFLKGNLLLFIAAWVLQGRVLSREVIEQTLLLRLYCDYTPLGLWELAKSVAISSVNS